MRSNQRYLRFGKYLGRRIVQLVEYSAGDPYDGDVGTTQSKRALAGQAWRPLARFFFDTVRHRQRILGAHGLTPNDMRALAALDTRAGRTMRELADEWACDASNATWIVDRLEERGLAERRSVPNDRRVKSVVLTTAGAKTRDRVLEALFEPPPELLELEADDLVALRDALAKLPVTRPTGARPTR
jgi:DNA-binding MarR family transcriptional regulator